MARELMSLSMMVIIMPLRLRSLNLKFAGRYMIKKVLSTSVYLSIFVVGVSLVVINQKTISYTNLFMMLLGLAMLLFLLFSHNKKFNN